MGNVFCYFSRNNNSNYKIVKYFFYIVVHGKCYFLDSNFAQWLNSINDWICDSTAKYDAIHTVFPESVFLQAAHVTGICCGLANCYGTRPFQLCDWILSSSLCVYIEFSLLTLAVCTACAMISAHFQHCVTTQTSLVLYSLTCAGVLGCLLNPGSHKDKPFWIKNGNGLFWHCKWL